MATTLNCFTCWRWAWHKFPHTIVAYSQSAIEDSMWTFHPWIFLWTFIPSPPHVKWALMVSTFSINESSYIAMVIGLQFCVWSGPKALWLSTLSKVIQIKMVTQCSYLPYLYFPSSSLNHSFNNGPSLAEPYALTLSNSSLTISIFALSVCVTKRGSLHLTNLWIYICITLSHGISSLHTFRPCQFIYNHFSVFNANSDAIIQKEKCSILY